MITHNEIMQLRIKRMRELGWIVDPVKPTIADIERGYCQIEDGAVYECYFPKQRTFWNGWACPAGLTAKSLCDFLAVSLEGRSNPADLELCTELLTSIVPQVYGDITLYDIGDGLIWDECTAEGGNIL